MVNRGYTGEGGFCAGRGFSRARCHVGVDDEISKVGKDVCVCV